MAISVNDAYYSTYCYEQMLQGNDSANCSVEEEQNNNSSANVQSQENQQQYIEDSNQGNNIDIEA